MAKNPLSDLLAQRAALEKKIADMQRVYRGDAIAKVKAMMAEFGLTAADIGGVAGHIAPRNIFGNVAKTNNAASSVSKPVAAPAPAAAKRRKPSANAGRKVAPKFRNPATGDTWSGRGLKPKWLAAAVASGRAMSEFAL